MSVRRIAREAALKALYQCELTHDPKGDGLALYWEHFPVTRAARPYGNELVTGVLSNLPVIDQWIERSADNWRLERISTIDRNILRLAIFEMLFSDRIPPKVAINEALEIARTYSGENACSFVNGVLDRVLKDWTRETQGGSVAAGA